MKLVIAPKNNHLELLLFLRKNNPFLDIKLMSKEDLEKSFLYKGNNDSILYLMKEKGYSYEFAKSLLQDISYIDKESDNKKINELQIIKNELIEKEVFYSPINTIDKYDEVEIIGYPKEDFELVNLLKLAGLDAKYTNLNSENKKHEVVEFLRIEEEVYFVLNEIASLIDKGINIKDIYLLKRSSAYDYYLNKFSPSFGYRINLNKNESFYFLGGVKEFLKIYDSNKDLKESLISLKELMKDDPTYLDIEEVVNSSIIEDSSFELQKDYLVNKFKEKKIKEVRYTPALNVIDYPILNEDKCVFVLGFAQGEFPRSYKDDHYLSDKELSSINRLNSKDKTRIDEASLINFFNSNNKFHFSYSKSSNEGSHFASPISKKLDYKVIHKELPSSFYSEEVIKLIYANLRDLDNFYKERKDDYYKCRDVIEIKYDTYSNKYENKANAFDEDSKIRLSTTSLDLFSKCPFHYYLDKVIKLDEFESTYAISMGNIAHKCFEKFREPDFDFERVFEEEMNKYEFSPSEKYLLTHNVKKQIKTAIEDIKKREENYNSPRIYNELNINKKITDNTTLQGQIDNLVILDNKYIICIDYKTGSTKFERNKLEFGQSSQLPTYSYLISDDNRFKDKQVIGLYINNVMTSSLKDEKKEEDLIHPYLKLNGVSLASLETMVNADKTLERGKSEFINGLSTKIAGGLKENSSLITQEEFESYREIIYKFYLEMDKKLRNNEFDISPSYFSDSANACQYCSYRDVCFVKSKQYRILKKEENSDE